MDLYTLCFGDEFDHVVDIVLLTRTTSTVTVFTELQLLPASCRDCNHQHQEMAILQCSLSLELLAMTTGLPTTYGYCVDVLKVYSAFIRTLAR
jgi:hypothetical protein